MSEKQLLSEFGLCGFSSLGVECKKCKGLQPYNDTEGIDINILIDKSLCVFCYYQYKKSGDRADRIIEYNRAWDRY